MINTFQNAVDMFLGNNIEGIRKFSGWFAKKITVNLLNNNREELNDLCKNASNMRSDIEFSEPIKITKEFYFGYCAAYENIARKVIEDDDKIVNIDVIIKSSPSLRLDKIINFLGNHGYAQQNELASYLGISPSHLWNILNNTNVKNIDIFNVQKIGKHVLYGLNQRGKQYFENKTDSNYKQYSKKEIIDLITNITKNMDQYKENNVNELTKLLDEDLSKELYKIINELRLRNELLNRKSYNKSIIYNEKNSNLLYNNNLGQALKSEPNAA